MFPLFNRFWLCLVISGCITSSIFAQTPQAQLPPPSPCLNEKGKVLHVGNGITPPQGISTKTDLSGSREEKKRRVQETTVLTLVIGTDGHVCDAKLVRSSSRDKDFNEKVVTAVKEWRFEPARKEGKPVPVEVSLEINFNLY